MEYWDLYNDKREPLFRTRERHEVFEDGEFYTCVEMWLVNSVGKLLTTRRHPDKKRGGMWEFTGGGVLAGETTKEAAIREVNEELGLKLKESEIELFTTYQHKNYFMDIYIIRKDVDVNELILQENEVSEAKFVTMDEFEQMCDEGIVVYSVSQRFKSYREKL